MLMEFWFGKFDNFDVLVGFSLSVLLWFDIGGGSSCGFQATVDEITTRLRDIRVLLMLLK